jgi:hypothetical protein
MHTNLPNGPAAFALSLLLALAPQAGSCRGGGGDTRDSRAADAANRREGQMNAVDDTKAGGDATNAAANESAAASEGAAGGAGERGRVARGTWGGKGVRLDVHEGGARVEFDCAHGTLEKLSADAGGNFDVGGTFVRERGGPEREGEERAGTPARYRGKVEGQTMTLRVAVEGGDELPTFTLAHGAEARLRKCL